MLNIDTLARLSTSRAIAMTLLEDKQTDDAKGDIPPHEDGWLLSRQPFRSS